MREAKGNARAVIGVQKGVGFVDGEQTVGTANVGDRCVNVFGMGRGLSLETMP